MCMCVFLLFSFSLFSVHCVLRSCFSFCGWFFASDLLWSTVGITAGGADDWRATCALLGTTLDPFWRYAGMLLGRRCGEGRGWGGGGGTTRHELNTCLVGNAFRVRLLHSCSRLKRPARRGLMNAHQLATFVALLTFFTEIHKTGSHWVFISSGSEWKSTGICTCNVFTHGASQRQLALRGRNGALKAQARSRSITSLKRFCTIGVWCQTSVLGSFGEDALLLLVVTTRSQVDVTFTLLESRNSSRLMPRVEGAVVQGLRGGHILPTPE